MSFHFVLSLFPFLIVIGSVVGWLPSTSLWPRLVQWITYYLPYGSRRMLFATILDLKRGGSGVLSLGLAATIWTASSGFVSMMEALSVAYEVKETRGFWKKRMIAICATIIGAVFLIASFGLLTFGRRAASALSVHIPVAVPWEWGRFLASLALMFLGLAFVNYFLPDIKRPWRWLTPGTVFTALGFFAMSEGFNFYLRHFANYPRYYGAMAGFVVLMIWVYLTSLILLIGAEADSVIERLHCGRDTA